jgi:cold shock CspA family protein/ribosome-associated translation inhibitor RaiA
MKVPLEIVFKGIEHSDEAEALIREEADKLEKVCHYMMSCRVAVEKRQQHQEVGNPYRVRIDMTVPPGHELVVKREPSKGDMHDPLNIVIKGAFASAARQLRKLVEQQRGDVKTHPEQQVMAVVHKLFPQEGYGFLRTVDTQDEIYFHRNSVHNGEFDQLTIGLGVRYTAELGDKGLQATSVQIVDKPRTPVEAPFRG